MRSLRASEPGFIRLALLLAVISSLQAARPVADETSNTGHSHRSGIGLRQFVKDPAPCGPKQSHLFVNRPCTPRTGGDNTDTNTDDTGDSQPGTNGGGPVIVLGGSPYHLDDSGPSGDHPNPGYTPPHDNTKLPDHFEPTPEPAYMLVTGMAFAAVWLLGRNRRTA